MSSSPITSVPVVSTSRNLSRHKPNFLRFFFCIRKTHTHIYTQTNRSRVYPDTKYRRRSASCFSRFRFLSLSTSAGRSRFVFFIFSLSHSLALIPVCFFYNLSRVRLVKFDRGETAGLLFAVVRACAVSSIFGFLLAACRQCCSRWSFERILTCAFLLVHVRVCVCVCVLLLSLSLSQLFHYFLLVSLLYFKCSLLFVI